MLIFRAWATCGLSVKFVFSVTIAYEGPDIRGNLRNTIAFADSQTENKPVKEGLINGVVALNLRLSAKILALLRLSVNVFQLRITKKLKFNFFCFKELNINKPAFFASSKQN